MNRLESRARIHNTLYFPIISIISFVQAQSSLCAEANVDSNLETPEQWLNCMSIFGSPLMILKIKQSLKISPFGPPAFRPGIGMLFPFELPTAKPKRLTESRAEYLIKASVSLRRIVQVVQFPSKLLGGSRAMVARHDCPFLLKRFCSTLQATSHPS